MDSFENLPKLVKEWYFSEGINRPDEHRLNFSGGLEGFTQQVKNLNPAAK